MKITPTWKVLTTFSRNFPPAKIITFTVYCITAVQIPHTLCRFSSSLVLASSISSSRFCRATSTVSHCSLMSRDVSSRMLSISWRSCMDAILSCSARTMLSCVNCAHDSGVDWLKKKDLVMHCKFFYKCHYIAEVKTWLKIHKLAVLLNIHNSYTHMGWSNQLEHLKILS